MTIADTPTSIDPGLTTLDNASWELYERLVQERDACGQHFKITYYRGRLVIGMPPLPIHENLKKTLGWLVEIAAAERDITLVPYGSTTWKLERFAGMEPDECYYVGHEPTFDPAKSVDLRHEPAPDLAIEVDITHHPPERLAAYAALGVKEVWRYDGRRVEILHRAVTADRFEAIPSSKLLSFITTADLNRFVAMLGTSGVTATRGAIRDWARSLRR